MIGWGELFRAGGAMGFTPKQVREMSLWEFHMTVDGFKRANGPNTAEGDDEFTDPVPPTEEEFFEAMKALGKN